MTIANMANVATIHGFTKNGAVTTSQVDMLGGAVATHSIVKINTIIIANIDGTNAATVTIGVSTDGGSNYHNIAHTVSVPADATLVAVDKNSSFYLDEGDLIRVTGSANSDLTYLISGEEIID